jgi:hypothetical protein
MFAARVRHRMCELTFILLREGKNTVLPDLQLQGYKINIACIAVHSCKLATAAMSQILHPLTLAMID